MLFLSLYKWSYLLIIIFSCRIMEAPSWVCLLFFHLLRVDSVTSARVHTHAPAQECTICGCNSAVAPSAAPSLEKCMSIKEYPLAESNATHHFRVCGRLPVVWPHAHNTGSSWHQGFPLDGPRSSAATASEVFLPSKPQPSPGPRGPSLGENH